MPAKTPASSARRVRANRRNARKSTGPRTDAGKARSSRNATGYGIFCQSLVLPGEDKQMLEMLRTSLIHEHRPQNVTELFLVDRMASAMWRLRRIQAAEADAHAAIEDQMIEEANVARRELQEEMEWDEDDEEDEEDKEGKEDEDAEKKQDCVAAAPRPLPASVTTCGLINDGQGKLSTLEKFSLYEKRLEGTMHRCLGDLRKLRTSVKGEVKPDRPSPFLETKIEEPEQAVNSQVSAEQPLARDKEKVKNEPIAREPDPRPADESKPDNDAKEEWKEQLNHNPTLVRAFRVEDQ